MRESAPESKSPASFLSHCLVESDPAARAAGRRTRVASVAASLAMQAALLTVLIIVPLFAAGKLPMMKFDAPAPIYLKGDPGAPPPVAHPAHTGGPQQPNAARPEVTPFQPSKIPPTVAEIIDGGRNTPGYRGPGPGVPDGMDMGGAVPPGGRLDTFVKPQVDLPPPPTPRAPVKVHEKIMEARLIHRVMPVYPALPKQIGRNGQVVMRAIIGTDGVVHSLEFVSGDPMFWISARDAVMRWRYTPTLLNGQPIEVETVVTVTYEIKRY